MARPKGAKNKPRSSEELIAELQRRKVSIPENLLPASGVVKGNQATTAIKETRPATGETDGIAREQFSLTLNQPSSSSDQQVFRCGNKLCKKVLDKEYPVCPFCDVKLNWG